MPFGEVDAGDVYEVLPTENQVLLLGGTDVVDCGSEPPHARPAVTAVVQRAGRHEALAECVGQLVRLGGSLVGARQFTALRVQHRQVVEQADLPHTVG